jgi:hypothetical protein
MTNKLLAEIEENSQRMDDNFKRRIERREESVEQGLATVCPSPVDIGPQPA